MSKPIDERAPLLPAGSPGLEAGQNGQTEGVSTKRLVLAVLALGLGVFLAAMDGTIIVSIYAIIGSEFNQLQNVTWIATSYMLTLTCFQPLYGKMSDIFGRRPCLLFAYIVFGIGSLSCGMARSLPQLVAARAFAGIGGAGVTTVSAIVLSDLVPLRQRGTWQGVLNLIFTVGSISGGPIGGFMVDSIGWRWAFNFQVPIALASIIAVAFTLRLPKQGSEDEMFMDKLARVDFAGAFFLITPIFSLLLALDRGSNVAWSDIYTIMAFVAFVVLGATFLIVEFYFAKEPIAPKRILTHPSLFASNICFFFASAGITVSIYNIPLYLQVVLGMTPHEVGLWIMPAIIGALIGSLGGGVVIQSTGNFFWITFATCFIGLVGAVLIVLNTGVIGTSFTVLVIGWIITAVGTGSTLTTCLVALIATAGQEDQAIVTAVSYLFRSLGSVVCLSVASGVFQLILRSALHSRLSGHVADSELEEIIHRVRESLDAIDRIPGAKESYAEAIQSVLWFFVVVNALSWLASCWIKSKKVT